MLAYGARHEITLILLSHCLLLLITCLCFPLCQLSETDRYVLGHWTIIMETLDIQLHVMLF